MNHQFSFSLFTTLFLTFGLVVSDIFKSNNQTCTGPITCGTQISKNDRLHYWPFLVSLNVYDKKLQRYIHKCSGTILNEYLILTAASCFEKHRKAADWIVIMNKHNIFDATIHKPFKWSNKRANGYLRLKWIKMHGGFIKHGFVNDIAVVHVRGSIPGHGGGFSRTI